MLPSPPGIGQDTHRLDDALEKADACYLQNELFLSRAVDWHCPHRLDGALKQADVLLVQRVGVQHGGVPSAKQVHLHTQ